MSKNVYLASGFHWREHLRLLAQKLIMRNYRICSSWVWLEERPIRVDPKYDEFAYRIANSNVIDLLIADILIVDARGIAPDNSGGVHFELGFAIAKNIEVYLIGNRTNTFHWLDDVKRVDSEEELLACLPQSND